MIRRIGELMHPRRPRIVLTAASLAALFLLSAGGALVAPPGSLGLLTETLGAQQPGRGAIQTPTGGRGPGAAPEADHPANAEADFSPKPPVLPLTPEEQAKQFWLPAGYRLEPVLSDPLIDSPAHIAFDGNGRMYIAELRGYEQTPDGLDLLVPTGRISRHEDRDGDGTFEHHTVFVDDLLFPRSVMPFGADAILTNETNGDEIWKYTDTTGDGSPIRRSCSRPGSAGLRTWRRSPRTCSGPWTTGSTAP
jgi:hypothetical protein